MSYWRSIIESIADQVRALVPAYQPMMPFVVADIGEGPVTPLEERIGSQSRQVELRMGAGPGDDGAAGVSDRHRAELEVRIGYSTQGRARWADALRADDVEQIQAKLRDPNWWPATVHSLEVLSEAAVSIIEETTTGQELGMIVTIPVTVRYESQVSP